ncbi:hypothetical protein D3C76_1780800 [compost metagenome]
MAVGVNHRDHGLFRPVLIVEIEGCLGGFGGNQWVEDRYPVLTLNDGHVRQVIVANLIDPVGDFEQA